MPFESELDVDTTLKRIRFLFDTTVSTESFTALKKELEELHNRLSRLISEPTIGGQPVIRFVMSNIPEFDPKDLIITGRALIRIGEIWDKYTQLKQQVEFLIYARKNPDFVAMNFGNFDTPHVVTPDEDIEHFLNSIDQG